jgi:hypothetical protein
MPRPTGPANNASASEDRDIRNILLKVRRLVAVLPALAGLGCYEYTDTTSAGLHPGEVVRVALTAPGSAALAPAIGPGATSLGGRVMSLAPNDMTIALTEIDRSVGPEQFLAGEPISVPLASFAGVQRRRVDKGRTALAVGGVVALFVVGQVIVDQTSIFSSKGAVSGSTR